MRAERRGPEAALRNPCPQRLLLCPAGRGGARMKLQRTATGPGRRLVAMRRAAPRVHCITGYAAMHRVSEVLLAAGAEPVMAHAREEAGEIAATSGALAISTGTLSPGLLDAMLWASETARGAGRPWVLDPVLVGASEYRRHAIAALLARRPTVIRASVPVVLDLAGIGRRGRLAGPPDAAAAAHDLASHWGSVVAVTGPADLVTDGTRTLRISGGHPVMARTAALGSALSGVIGAFLAVPDDPLDAAAAALALFAAAGAGAGERAQGPGSFGPAFLDALAAIDGPDLDDAGAIHPA